ncbi:MAG: hypothetical protein IPK87_09470 [Planctomycetes bacterium]|nr:hypothetical protein [Planctomycetota bacterium]
MPPEQLQHQMLEIKETADIYSLGATLYELAALAPMFDGDSEARLMQQVLQEEPKGAKQINRAVPQDLNTIIKVATSKIPGDRYPTAKALQNDLEAFARGEPIVARAPGTFHYLRLFYSKNKALVATIAAAVVLMLATVSWFIVNLNASRAEAVAQKETAEQQTTIATEQRTIAEAQKQEAERQAKIATERKAEAERQTTIATERKTEAERQTKIANEQTAEAERQRKTAEERKQEAERQTELANSARKAAEEAEAKAIAEAERARKAEREAQIALADSMVAAGETFVTAGRHEEAREKYEAGRKALAELGLPTFGVESSLYVTYSSAPPPLMEYGGGDFGVIFDMAIAADGETVVMATESGVVLFDVKNWRRKRVLGEHRGSVFGIAISPDGRFIASSGSDTSVRIWDFASGALLHTFWGHTTEVGCVVFCGENEVASCGWDGAVKLWDLKGGAEKAQLLKADAGVRRLAWSPVAKVLVAIDEARGVYLLDVATAETRKKFEFSEYSFPLDVAFEPSGEAVWVCGTRGIIKRLSAVDGSELGVIEDEDRRLTSLTVSPDGKLVVVGGISHPTKLWNTADRTMLRQLPGHIDVTNGAVFTAQPDVLVTCGQDAQLRVWDLKEGKQTRRFHTDPYATKCVAFSPNGRLLATAPYGGGLRLWDAMTGRHVWHFEDLEEVNAMTFTPVRNHLFIGSKDTHIYWWDLEKWEDAPTLSGHTGPVSALAVSPDGKFLASGSWDRTVRIWELATSKCIRVIEAHEVPEDGYAIAIKALAWDPTGKLVASGAGDAKLYVWDVATGEKVFTATHNETVSGAFFTADNHVLTCDLEGSVHKWDLTSGNHKIRMLTDLGVIYVMRPSPDRTEFAIGQNGGYTKVCSTETGAVLRAWREQGDIQDLCWHPYHPMLVASSQARQIRLWSTDRDTELKSLRNIRQDHVTRVKFSKDGELIYGTGFSKGIQVWHARSRAHVAFFGEHNSNSDNFDVFPDGRTVMTAERGGILRTWDIDTGKMIHEHRGNSGPAWGVSMSPDGKRIAVGTSSGKVYMLDEKLQLVINPITIEGTVVAVEFTPDGKVLLVGTREGALVTYDAADLKPLKRFMGGQQYIDLWSATFSRDGQTLATGHSEGTVQFWDVATLRQLKAVKVHDAEITGLCYTPDGNFLLTCGYDGKRRLVDATKMEMVLTWVTLPQAIFDVDVANDGLHVVQTSIDGTMVYEDYGRPAVYREFEKIMPELHETLPWQEDDLDAAMAAHLARWYALRGIDEWALKFIEHAASKDFAIDNELRAELRWREGMRWLDVAMLKSARELYAQLEKDAPAEKKFSHQMAVKALDSQIKLFE